MSPCPDYDFAFRISVSSFLAGYPQLLSRACPSFLAGYPQLLSRARPFWLWGRPAAGGTAWPLGLQVAFSPLSGPWPRTTTLRALGSLLSV